MWTNLSCHMTLIASICGPGHTWTKGPYSSMQCHVLRQQRLADTLPSSMFRGHAGQGVFSRQWLRWHKCM